MPRLRDAALPPGLEPAQWAEANSDSGTWLRARFTADTIDHLLVRLADAGPAMRAVPTGDLLTAWDDAIRALLDASSAEHHLLHGAGDSPFAHGARLSPQGLAAALDAVLGGLRRPAADRLAADIAARAVRGSAAPRAVYLAANIPGLAAQPLLRGLLEGQPMLLKSASAEPFFAPALVAALAVRLPALAPGLAAITWPGGERAVEERLLAHGFEIELYGGASAVGALSARAPHLLVHGPMASLAIVSEDADLTLAARGLAEDIALFDQRGCLSIQAVYVIGSLARADEAARALARELRELERRLPPGPANAEELAGTQQLRVEAEMRGLAMELLSITAGTVVVDPRPLLVPSPGLRSVRVHPLARAGALRDLLEPWRGRLQGVATAGLLSDETRAALTALGVSRFAPAGELQRPDATWANWGERLGDGT